MGMNMLMMQNTNPYEIVILLSLVFETDGFFPHQFILAHFRSTERFCGKTF
jgi:hypothetical protein